MSLSCAHREQIYSELSKLIGAGLPASQAVQALLDHELPSAQHQVISGLDRSLREGHDLATAFEGALGKDAEGLDIALIRAGQAGGRLPESLTQLARHYARRHRTARTIRSQLIYPACLLHLGVLLPALPKIISQPDLDALWTALTFLLALWILLVAGYLIFDKFGRMATTNPSVDAFLNRIPLYGKMRRNGALSRFTDVLGFFLTAGQNVSTSLRAAGGSSGSGVLANTARGAAEAIESSHCTLGEAITGAHGVPKPLARGIHTAETSGTLDTEMERWSRIYSESTEEAARAFGAWLPRIIYFLVVLVVAWQIVRTASGIYAPMFKMLDQI